MAKSKFNEFVSALLLLVFSTLISLVFGEIVTRMIVDPGDYLEPYLVDDDILVYKLTPNSSGHDSWGFRNKRVPPSAKIVTIGDSQTYGVSASAGNSWPAKLQKLMKADVYNLSLGGYGPVQYYYLLKNRAFILRPRIIIVGFYFGNDLFDAYTIAYTNDHWKHLRDNRFAAGKDLTEADLSNHQRVKLMGGLRSWLAHHSVLYRMSTLSFGNVFRFLEIKYGHFQTTKDISILDHRERKLHTGFTPFGRLGALNLRDPKVREGLRITLESIRQMNDLCSNSSIQLMIALIPTKESVFADYIENNSRINNSDTIDELIANERQVNALMKKYFQQYNISYVDVLPDLQNAVGVKTIYPENEDGHPNAAGYEVIANAIHKSLTQRNTMEHSNMNRLWPID